MTKLWEFIQKLTKFGTMTKPWLIVDEWVNYPKYRTGDTVYFVHKFKKGAVARVRVDKTTIRSVPLSYYFIEDKHWLKFDGYYEISQFICSEEYLPPNWCHEKYIFLTKEEADKNAKYWTVIFTKEEWLRCIGDRNARETEAGYLEECELALGDINDGTADIRSFLIDVQETGGIVEVDRLELQEAVSKCYNRPVALDDENSLLSKLFKTLDLKWTNNANSST